MCTGRSDVVDVAARHSTVTERHQIAVRRSQNEPSPRSHERDGRVGHRSGPEPSGDPLGVCVASGDPGVASPPVRPHARVDRRWRHTLRVLSHTASGCHSCCAGCGGHRRRVTARDGVRRSVGPPHRHTPGGITAPRAAPSPRSEIKPGVAGARHQGHGCRDHPRRMRTAHSRKPRQLSLLLAISLSWSR